MLLQPDLLVTRLLQLLFLTLWVTQGQAKPTGAHGSKSECWYGNHSLYKDGEVVRSYGMYCTTVVCRGNRVVLEAIQNCTCLEISGLELVRTGAKWQVLKDDNDKDEEANQEQLEREEGGDEEEEYDYETDEGGEEHMEGEDEYGLEGESDYEGGKRRLMNGGGHLLINSRTTTKNGYPVGAMALPAAALAQKPAANQLPDVLSAKDLKRRRNRCRLNGWFPRLTDGTLQALAQNCVRLVCTSASNGQIGLHIQARTGCTCASE